MRAEEMHGCLGENIKIHFAGAEATDRLYFCYDAGVRYFLFTVLPFIMDQFGIKWGNVQTAKHIMAYEKLPQWSNHVIMDSGLFSLMFGACKDIRPDEAFIRRYKDAICAFVNDHQLFSFTCVECDCQKLLGVDLAWKLRQEMRDQLPHNRIINVFHFEDGRKGLDRLIEFAEYIAISVPELRIVKPKTYKEDTYRLASYIKEKKPEIDIHLLGGTEFEMVKRCKFCTSADSTSWVSCNRFGRILGNHVRELNGDRMKEVYQNSEKLLNDLGVKPSEKLIKYFSNYWVSAYLNRQKYIKYAGNQD